MFGIIAGVLLALLAAGVLATLFIKLTTTVGKYIMAKVREHKRRVAISKMKKVLEEINKSARKDQRDKINHELNPNDLLMWEQDANGEVLEESFEFVHEDQVDAKTCSILDAHNDLVYINPTAV